jgi:hypothetical protein
MRQRLSWSEEKVAEIMKQADPYTMNQDRKNPPIEKYETGDPSAWAEDQNKATPWKNEGRTETGHPAPAREAVVQARKLEDKALKCITIAQRMLPGAAEEMLEDQATDLMFLPEKSIMATLQRQSDLATKIAGETKEDDDADEKKEDEEKDAASKCKEEDEEEATAGKKKEEDEEATAGKKKDEDEMDEKDAAKAKKDDEEEMDEKDAAKAKKDDEEEVEAKKKAPKEEEVSAKKKDDEEEVEAKKAPKKEEEVEAKKVPKKEEEEVKASDKDLLDILFDNAEVAAATEAAAPKTGAKKLSGLVKRASTGDPLDNLWDTPPDVSSVFK